MYLTRILISALLLILSGSYSPSLCHSRMESFRQCAIQMLREFRAVLRISPIPITQLRLLQLTALNMFAIEWTQLKGE